MKKYQYLASWDDQTLTRVGEPVVVLGDSNVSQVEVTLPSDFLLDPTKAECRMYFLLPGEKESNHDVLETAVKDENGDSHVTWTIKHVHSQKGGRLAFSLTLIGDDAQWDSRTAIIPVYESRYQPESEEAEEPYTGRLDALEGSMAAIRGEFAEVQDDFEELKETATLGTPIPESLVANMQAGHAYIYTGTEPGYTAGHVYYYVGGALTDGGQYGGTTVDATLTQSGQAADAKVTGDKIAQIKEDLSQKAPIIVNTSDEAEVVTFSDGADDMPMKSVVLNLAQNQDGYTSVNVMRAGKNLLANTGPNSVTNNGITFTKNADGSVTANGTASGGNATYYVLSRTSLESKFLISILNKRMPLYFTSSPDGASASTFKTEITIKRSDAGTDGYIRDFATQILSLQYDISSLAVYIQVMNGQTVNNLIFKPMICFASVPDRTYEQYKGTTYPITLSQTVYGGEITINNPGITMLLGSNTIWMDTDGTIQCNYYADTKLYIDALTAPDGDMIADSNIASGKYFTVNNRLYLSTSAIAQGEAIVVGTNCTQTDLATALNAINA